jgi:hypothetical protein
MHIHPVVTNLYCADEITDWGRVRALDFDLIVSVGGDHASGFPPFHGAIFIDYHFNDGRLPDGSRLFQVCQYIVAALERGQRVLIHDKSGDNRCYLVAACVLFELGYGRGSAILKLIQSTNGKALSNPVFASFVSRLGNNGAVSYPGS